MKHDPRKGPHSDDDHRWELVGANDGVGVYKCLCGAVSHQSYGRKVYERVARLAELHRAEDVRTRKGVRKKMLERIKAFDEERSDIDEMVELLTFGELALATYEKNSLEAPVWLKENLGTLRKEIAARRRDNLEKALKLAEGRRDTLKSAEEKRQDTEAEINRLRTALAEAK